MEKYFFLENYVTLEGAVSHNVLYYQPLSITRNQERFYANNYFEELPIVSTAFNVITAFRTTFNELIFMHGHEYAAMLFRAKSRSFPWVCKGKPL